MPPQIRLVLALHNHQPVGNFDGVFENAYRDSYLPFLDVLSDYPEIPIVLHTSGSLLDWLEELWSRKYPGDNTEIASRFEVSAHDGNNVAYRDMPSAFHRQIR